MKGQCSQRHNPKQNERFVTLTSSPYLKLQIERAWKHGPIALHLMKTHRVVFNLFWWRGSFSSCLKQKFRQFVKSVLYQTLRGRPRLTSVASFVYILNTFLPQMWQQKRELCVQSLTVDSRVILARTVICFTHPILHTLNVAATDSFCRVMCLIASRCSSFDAVLSDLRRSNLVNE